MRIRPSILYKAPPPPALFERGRGLFNLAKTVVSVLHKELEYKEEKLKHKKVKVMHLRIKNKSELPVSE